MRLTFLVAADHGVSGIVIEAAVGAEGEAVLGPLQDAALVDHSAGQNRFAAHDDILVHGLHRKLLHQPRGCAHQAERHQQKKRRRCWGRARMPRHCLQQT